MKAALAVSLFALLVALGGLLWLQGVRADLEGRLADLETGGLRAEVPGARAEGGEAGLAGSGAQRELAELRRLTGALVARMEGLEEGARSAPAPGAADAQDLTAQPAFREAVRRQVLEMAAGDVDFRSRIGTADRTKIPKHAPFTAVAEALQLDASQEAQMGKDLQGMQTELFALLSEERTDGVVPMEIIAKAEALPEGDPRRAEFFVQLFTLKVPGGEETYMQRAVTLQQSFRKRIGAYLRPRQQEILDAVEIDWFSIKFN